MIARRDLLLGAGIALVVRPLEAAEQKTDAAIDHVKKFYESLQSVLASPQASDPRQRAGALYQVMDQAFDLGRMTRLAIGPQWSQIPAAKRDALQDVFGRYFVANFASRLGQASGSRFEVLPNAEHRSGGTLVRTRVVDAQGKSSPVDYLVSPEGRITDIYLNGTVSELATYRSEIAAALKAGGPDALESNLRKRTDELSGGT